jgi:hypothetical protein
MKASFLLLPLAALAALFGGCSGSQPPLPTIHYPVTYQVPIGNTSGQSSAGAQSMNVSATQDVEVQAGLPLYYQINSPVNVTVYIYEKVGAAPGGNLLGQMQIMAGAPTTNQIIPRSTALEFTFTASQPNSSGTLQFTLSDQPIAPAAPAMGVR